MNPQNNKSKKAQSAMEYLMTYGWAILIIAVVLAALDMLGVFSGSTFLGTSCLATPGYSCSSPIISTNTLGDNLLSFNFSETGQTLYNVKFACAATSNSITGLPNSGTSNAFSPVVANTLISGSTITVTGITCFGSNGNAFANNPIGTAFSGQIWMNYTKTSSTTTANIIAIIAKVTAKVS
ncbi:MAG: hypothetical protein QXP35_02315 [Candidatus Micrarchaeaceae archaeon]